MALSSGTRLGHYEIITPIGAGGMGEVYLAHDSRLERKVAIKILSGEFSQKSDRLRRFTQEARAVSALNHPNIITIHEVGESDGSHFIATEYIEGKTLRQRLVQGPMPMAESLDIATQIASALAAAHAAGIIHRDVKPENVMLRPDGYVKVLDFGLAKLVEKPGLASATTEAERLTVLTNITEPGVLMGTVRYMSPEQARGKSVDLRTDIFSFGVCLYEMLTGCMPFEGESTLDTLTAILHHEPLPIAQYQPTAPPELQRILYKTMRKSKEERYQDMQEVITDLKTLREELHIQSRLEGSASKPAPAVDLADQPTVSLASDATSGAITHSTHQQTLSANANTQSLVSPARSRQRRIVFALAILIIVAVAAYFYVNRQPALTERDTILVADFVNTTGDSIFDGTLKQGLSVQLQQSPFFNVFPDIRVRQTLPLMNLPQNARVTVDVGREICERHGLKALIVGTIAPLGSHYVITLEAVNGRTGEVLASEQTEAESKEQVLKALGRAASRIREKLGEGLNSIQNFDAPLEATTSSLEALKAFSLGVEQSQNGNFLDAIPFYKRALELDPNFGYAYGTLAVNYNNTRQPRLAAENATRAYDLRGRMSELERLRIESFYNAFVTGDIEKGIDTLEIYRRIYPRDERGPLNLSDRYNTIGQFERAVEQGEEALRLNPNNAVGYWNLAESFLRLGRYAEAKARCEQAIAQKLDTIALHYFLYQIAFHGNDMAAMQAQLDWVRGRPDEYMALDWQMATLAAKGQWRLAQDFSRRSIDLAQRSAAKELAARYAAEAALRAAILKQCAPSESSVTQALALERNQVSLTRSALALALCGEAAPAQELVEELSRRYPKDTLINGIWLPAVRAALELQRGDANQAIVLLDPAKRYEPASEFWVPYLRGQAYLQLRSPAEAITEFQKILDHRGEAILSILYPLAHLGVARATALAGDRQKSRQAYQEFFARWQEADADLIVLQEAKREAEKVK